VPKPEMLTRSSCLRLGDGIKHTIDAASIFINPSLFDNPSIRSVFVIFRAR
jgi:hypothetical protein